jgi:BirA family transcriptional regulator, biotin operon repressor / biotin---[acetyl-CoA-carboxylase] ligase
LTPSVLDLERLQRELSTARFGRSLHYVERTGSTNDDARSAIARSVSNGHTIVSDAQSAGRGSRGRLWESPAGTDLYVSIVDRLPVALSELPPLTLAVGLAVADTADALLRGSGAPASQVKWPNDMFIGSKKCAGVLIETSTGLAGGDAVVIGIGLNVNRSVFAPELAAHATSLCTSHPAHAPIDRTRALGVLLNHVEARVDQFVSQGATAIVRELEPRLFLLGRRVRVEALEGVIRGVAPSGALLLETDYGLRHVIAGRPEPVA